MLRDVITPDHKVKIYNKEQLNLSPNIIEVKVIEDLFKELHSRYPKDIIKASWEMEG